MPSKEGLDSSYSFATAQGNADSGAAVNRNEDDGGGAAGGDDERASGDGDWG